MVGVRKPSLPYIPDGCVNVCLDYLGDVDVVSSPGRATAAHDVVAQEIHEECRYCSPLAHVLSLTAANYLYL